MALVTTETLVEVCADQGVHLSKRFAEEAAWSPSDRESPYYFCYTTTDMTEYAAWAGRILRLSPQEKLATGVVEVAGTPLMGDPAALLLVGMINDSIVRPEPGPSELSKVDSGSKRIDTCESAEYYFLDTLTKIDARPWDVGPYTELFVTNNTPALLRKFEGRASSLLLKDVMINNIRYKRGSLMNMVAKGDTVGSDMAHMLRDSGLHVREFDEVEQLAFMRPSALNFSVPFRWEAFADVFHYTPEDLAHPLERFVPQRKFLASLPTAWPRVVTQNALNLLTREGE